MVGAPSPAAGVLPLRFPRAAAPSPPSRPTTSAAFSRSSTSSGTRRMALTTSPSSCRSTTWFTAGALSLRHWLMSKENWRPLAAVSPLPSLPL